MITLQHTAKRHTIRSCNHNHEVFAKLTIVENSVRADRGAVEGTFDTGRRRWVTASSRRFEDWITLKVKVEGSATVGLVAGLLACGGAVAVQCGAAFKLAATSAYARDGLDTQFEIVFELDIRALLILKNLRVTIWSEGSLGKLGILKVGPEGVGGIRRGNRACACWSCFAGSQLGSSLKSRL